MNIRHTLLYILLVALLFSNSFNAQRLLKISVSINGDTEHLSYVIRKGISFISAKEITTILGGTFYYNLDAAKVEMKFDNFNLKVTARNQFLILISKADNTHQVYQIPISTLLIKNDVFLPLVYCIDYINLAYQKEILFDEKEKHLTVTGKSVDVFAHIKKEEHRTSPAPPKSITSKVINSKYEIYSMEINEKTNGTLIRLRTTKPIHRYSSSIQEGKLRLYISGATVSPDILSNFRPTGFIRKVEVKSVKGNKQIEFLLKDGYSMHEATNDIDSDDIIITIHNKVFSKFEDKLEAEINEWNFNTIVIDAGHGGKDPGAIGITGVREKDVNLAIALKLGGIIKKKMTDVNVVYTRNTDNFVELYKRGKIANENDGKLFISIHCNSLGRKNSSTRGFEVYLLRPGKTQKAIEIAEFENSVINYEDSPDRYQKLTDENFILVSMAHSAYMRYSEKYSELLNKNWLSGVKGVPSRGIKQAGFYVLVGASMPGVLVETGFLSNKKDEKYLKSSKGQKEIAEAIFKTIKEYKSFYEEQLAEES